jgi:3-hydroxyacyl-CoA dehydrogenase/enoyl-CoA hydratase/3-hydroxybutyryl-CoA epimerase
MGAGITSVAVQQGTLVRLKDTDTARVGKGLAAVRDVVKERYTKRQITRPQLDDMMALTGGTTEYTGFGNVDLVIEAVFEDIDLKHRVLREVEPLMPEDAIYASNTSTIPIGRIAEAATRPEQVLGMHFFSPVHKMPLLEIIVTPRTTKDATVTAVAYGKQLGKTVIVVNDGPGFYTTLFRSTRWYIRRSCARSSRCCATTRSTRRTRARSRSAGSLKWPSVRIVCSGCTSSPPCTGCRCWK